MSRALPHRHSRFAGSALSSCVLASLFALPNGAHGASLTPLGDLPGGTFHSEFGALSMDGSTVVGWSDSASGRQAFIWSLAGGMVGLGDLPGGGFDSVATAVSANGSVVVGSANSSNGIEAFRWTAKGGMVGLGVLPGGAFSSQATVVSADGSVIAGITVSASGHNVFRWTAAEGMTGLSDVVGGEYPSRVTSISDDGHTVVGGVQLHPFRWALGAATAWQGVSGAGVDCYAAGVSADGKTTVGANSVNAPGSPGYAFDAFLLRSAAGTDVMTTLGKLGGYNSSLCWAVSSDGTTAVGNAMNVFRFGQGAGPAFRWTEAGGTVPLGDLSQGTLGSSARSVSADGSVIVGYAPTGGGLETFLWTAASGLQSLKAALLSKGISPADSGWTALAVSDSAPVTVSRDGRWVAGTGTHNGKTEAFLADLQGAPPFSVTAAAAGERLSLRWTAAAGLTYSVQRSIKADGPYVTIASGLTAGEYNETPPAGPAQFYRVTIP